jgi:hypothetical protein
MESKEFAASRLSGNNSLMPTKYKVNDFGVTIIDPGIFNSKQNSHAFFDMESVELNNPLIGFSTVTITTENGKFDFDGLYNTDAQELHDLIQAGIAKARMANRNLGNAQ